jgi:hypothetical protein
MQWIRSHLSFANSISLIALFVALGGTSLAAVTLSKNSVGAKQIKKNAVRASEIKSGAVGASEIRSNAVASGDIADNGVGGSDLSDNSVGAGELSDNSVGGGELADNSVGTGEITNDSLTATDIVGSSLDSEVGPDAFARVQGNGTLEGGVGATGGPAQFKAVDQADVQHAAVGIYCFGGLDFVIASALAIADNAGAAVDDQIATVAIQRGNTLGGCDADHQQARVQTFDVSTAALVDTEFTVWFER